MLSDSGRRGFVLFLSQIWILYGVLYKGTTFYRISFIPVKGDLPSCGNDASDEVWCAFDRFQRRRQCYVLHSRRDFFNILSDLKSDNGNFVVMARDDEDSGSEIVSMAWAVRHDDILLVTDVMGEDSDARSGALRQLRCLNGDMPVLLYGHPDDSMGGRLMPRGMGRFVM